MVLSKSKLEKGKIPRSLKIILNHTLPGNKINAIKMSQLGYPFFTRKLGKTKNEISEISEVHVT